MRLPSFLTAVTPFSKFLALLLFITFPLLGFYLGITYQQWAYPPQNEVLLNQSILIPTLTPTPIIDTLNWKSFTEPNYGFSFNHPAAWDVRVQKEGVDAGTFDVHFQNYALLITNIPPQEGAFEPVIMNVGEVSAVMVEYSDTTDMSLDTVLKKVNKYFTSVNWRTYIESQTEKKFQLRNAEGVRIDMKFKKHLEFPADYRSYVYIKDAKNNKIWNLEFHTPRSEESNVDEKLFNEFNALIASLRFLDEGTISQQKFSGKTYCDQNGGNWLDELNECEFTTADNLDNKKLNCKNAEGKFNACASACRHIESFFRGETTCTTQCIPVCSFE